MSEPLKKPQASGTAPARTAKPAEPEVQFLAAASPHIRDRDDIPRIMWTVVIALVPALLAACYFFQWPAIRTVLIALVTAVLTEAVIRKVTRRKVTVNDGSAVVTGLLVAFVTPSNAPWFIPLIESAFAIAVVKQAFGGLGQNVWNPALAARAFAVACFASVMTGGWLDTPPQPTAVPPVKARTANWVKIEDIPLAQRTPEHGYSRVDETTGASPLSARKDYLRKLNTDSADRAARKEAATTPAGAYDLSRLSQAEKDELKRTLGTTPRDTIDKVRAANRTPLFDLLIGARVGCVGETSALALLIGGVILLATGVIRWHITLSFIATVAFLGWLLPLPAWAYDPDKQLLTRGIVWCAGQPLFEILTGGVLLGAIFMATDPVTSPITRTGRLIFGFGCGLLTVIIRKYGGYPEGVCYSILLINSTVPLIDANTRPRVYGKKK